MIKMRNFSEEEEQDSVFFDTREEISSVSDWSSDCGDGSPSAFNSFSYDNWTRSPESVQDRRQRFLKWMGLSLNGNECVEEEYGNDFSDKIQLGVVDRMVDNSRAMLKTSSFEDGFWPTHSSMSSESNEAWRQSFENGVLDGNFVCKIKNLDDGMEFLVDELDEDRMLSRLDEVGSNQSLSFEEFRRTFATSPLVERFLKKNVNDERGIAEAKRKAKRSWLEKLGLVRRIVDRQGTAASKTRDLESTTEATMQRVKVHPSKKNIKDMSSLFTGQEFLAHKGSILTIKFSLDGQYLASGGEDGVVRVWKVIEDDRSNHFDIPATDPSCLYFTMNHLSELASLDVDMKKIDKMKRHGSSDSTCVVVPPKVFRVLEKPLHEFQGHSGEVLDLSWSKKRFLVSSSVDQTARLWQVGCDRCLRVFSHNNYVTSVDFNPVDENYFISGSIDGKVRIWEVLGCRVVDYTDIREIVTAVCYHPGGKRGLVGTMTGNCLFYDIIDNQLQLDAQICLQGKKKLPGKRITGFEFSPSDPSKVVVTSADSRVRVLCGLDVVCKFRGLRSAANQTSASFTSDGKHIISTSEDFNVYVWNNAGHERTSRAKNIQSCESFLSQNASVAIPWRGIETIPGTLSSPESTCGDSFKSDHKRPKFRGELDQKKLSSSSDCFSLARGFLLESLTRGSATWPEEKLPNSSPKTASPTKCRPEFKYLKNACHNMLSSHMWGLVIVTAGWDGRIRTYLNYGLPLRL
ncbi:TRANSDUCIN/WD40 REPEAT-LIKE SUPERFAMILY PROTEIN [Salix viminalis]|uniref:TRANSDUCIN/WD40 REPEAT-LIKE SUPERFAMILY PROTEIN n=1 Tax=Salix viminalis TaxID=40686 RepID=A0A6N2JZU6_SALVM|nr:TRANSDUCIN/WD40 REPEAT-LIKE SUPERFAMILY PROTEIN [Salix viminalis]